MEGTVRQLATGTGTGTGTRSSIRSVEEVAMSYAQWRRKMIVMVLDGVAVALLEIKVRHQVNDSVS